MSEEVPKFEQWCVVELFGHQKLAGKVIEQTIAGSGFLRIDVPRADGSFVTKLQNPKSVYGISPCSEEVARAVAVQLYGIEPIRPVDFKQLPVGRDADDEQPWDEDGLG
jgi:hypothetical protein